MDWQNVIDSAMGRSVDFGQSSGGCHDGAIAAGGPLEEGLAVLPTRRSVLASLAAVGETSHGNRQRCESRLLEVAVLRVHGLGHDVAMMLPS